jgi:hypothetical protein
MRFTTIASLCMVAALASALPASAQFAPPPAQCTDTPRGCLLSRGKFKMDLVRRTLAWKWTGSGIGIFDVDNPTLDTGYDLCVYDANQTLVLATGVPPGGICPGGAPCWRARRWGFEYRDGTGLAGGLTKIQLRVASGRRDRLVVAGGGPYLPLPTVEPALPLTVQLVRTEPQTCWGSIATRLR